MGASPEYLTWAAVATDKRNSTAFSSHNIECKIESSSGSSIILSPRHHDTRSFTSINHFYILKM